MINYYWELAVTNYNSNLKKQKVIIEATSEEEAKNILLGKMPSAEIHTIKEKHYSNIFTNNAAGKWFEVKGSIVTIDFFTNKEKCITVSFLSQGIDSENAIKNCEAEISDSSTPITLLECKEKKIAEVILKQGDD